MTVKHSLIYSLSGIDSSEPSDQHYKILFMRILKLPAFFSLAKYNSIPDNRGGCSTQLYMHFLAMEKVAFTHMLNVHFQARGRFNQ